GEELGHLHLGERPDDLVHVAAGAEGAPFPGDHHRAHLVAARKLREEIAQLAVDLEGQRVELLGPCQGDQRHPVLALLVTESFRLGHGGLLHHSSSGRTQVASISTSARSSSRSATCTSAMAGKCLPMCLRQEAPTASAAAW